MSGNNPIERAEATCAPFPPTTWSQAVWPGGQVCAVPMPGMPDGICGMPVESEPCPEHTRRPGAAEPAAEHRR